MKCVECGRFNKSRSQCSKWKTNIANPHLETDCKAFTAKTIKQNEVGRQQFGSAEFRNKEGYEVVGGLVHVSPYWHKENKCHKNRPRNNNHPGKKK